MKHLSLILLSVFAAITLAAAAQAVPTGAPAPVIPSYEAVGRLGCQGERTCRLYSYDKGGNKNRAVSRCRH